MEQAQRAGARPAPGHAARSPRRCRGCAPSSDISHYTVEINRLENDGDRVSREAIASLFDDGIDPMVVIRWKDIFERLEEAIDATRARREHPRGHRHQERRSRPMDSDVILVIVVATALAFDFTNGFHDTANAVATSISTRALSPRVAVALAAVLNFVGAFISLAVAATIAKGIVEADAITTTIVFAGLIGAIAWNLATWYFGLPSSSSHALIGGVVGAAFVAERRRARSTATAWSRRSSSRRSSRRSSPSSWPGSRSSSPTGSSAACAPGRSTAASGSARSCPASMLALAHGTNDAQKTMGIITLALVANGNLAGRRLRRPDLGRRLLGDARSRSAPTSAAGGSSARWAAGSSRWTRRRASPPRARARR